MTIYISESIANYINNAGEERIRRAYENLPDWRKAEVAAEIEERLNDTQTEGSMAVGRVSSHAPTFNLIDLDYPLYGTTVVKCDGRKFDLEVVRKALALAAELAGEIREDS